MLTLYFHNQQSFVNKGTLKLQNLYLNGQFLKKEHGSKQSECLCREV